MDNQRIYKKNRSCTVSVRKKIVTYHHCRGPLNSRDFVARLTILACLSRPHDHNPISNSKLRGLHWMCACILEQGGGRVDGCYS